MDQREIDEIAAWLAQEKVCFMFIYHFFFYFFTYFMYFTRKYDVNMSHFHVSGIFIQHVSESCGRVSESDADHPTKQLSGPLDKRKKKQLFDTKFQYLLDWNV